jgi:predicted RNase H-like HicB family nuclease/post-segregation antitoxin (ccd killing protein)
MSGKKTVYPIVLTPAKEGGYCVTVPDIGNHTQGDDLADAIAMAKDAIEMMGVFLQDEGKPIPEPSDINSIKTAKGEIKTLVTVDFDAYRRATETKVVRKAVTIPSWLNVQAEEAGVNFSATLQEALKARLGV